MTGGFTVVQTLVGVGVQGDDFQWNAWLTLAVVFLGVTLVLLFWPDTDNGGEARRVNTIKTGRSSRTRDIHQGDNVYIGVPPPETPAPDPHLALDIEVLEPDQISNWDNDWRVTIRITNKGESEKFSAYLLSPVQGVSKPNYGDIHLQWETVTSNFTTLVKNKPERLHIVRVSRRRMARFLSPGEYGGDSPGRGFHHAPVKVTDSPISGSLRFTTLDGRCEQRFLEIHLDHNNKPTAKVGTPEPC